MDFYNFEKYNDVFCFEKLSGDYQPSLKIYKDNYKTLLNTFLKEYEENTELRFIENQLFFCNQEIKIQNSCIYSLEKLDHETFYYVKNRVGERHNVYMKHLNFDEDYNNSLIIQPPIENQINDNKELKAPTVVGISNEDSEDDILDMHATAKNFIKFISNRITSLCLINKFLEQRKQELQKVSKSEANSPQQNETIISDRSSQLHPKYDPNLWNSDCFELFKYLYDCYYKNTNRQLTNIWFFLKNHTGSAYVLKATKDEYTTFILEKYQKKLSNFDKAVDKWNEKELPTLQDHRIEFEGTLK